MMLISRTAYSENTKTSKTLLVIAADNLFRILYSFTGIFIRGSLTLFMKLHNIIKTTIRYFFFQHFTRPNCTIILPFKFLLDCTYLYAYVIYAAGIGCE